MYVCMRAIHTRVHTHTYMHAYIHACTHHVKLHHIHITYIHPITFDTCVASHHITPHYITSHYIKCAHTETHVTLRTSHHTTSQCNTLNHIFAFIISCIPYITRITIYMTCVHAYIYIPTYIQTYIAMCCITSHHITLHHII